MTIDFLQHDLLTDISVATINAVPFYLKNSKKEEGRRIIEHRFPHTPYTYLEDIGANPRTFEIEAMINGGELYLIQRTIFEIMINKKDWIILTHPLHGFIKCRVISHTIEESVTEFGSCHLTFNVIEELNEYIPDTYSNFELLKELAKQLLNIYLTRLTTSIVYSFPQNLFYGSSNIKRISNAIYSNSNLYGKNNSYVEIKHKEITSNSYNLAKNTDILSSDMVHYLELFQSIMSNSMKTIKGLSKIQTTPIDYEIDTQIRKERLINDRIFNSVICIIKLTLIITIASQYNFKTYVEIDQVSNILMNIYDELQVYNNVDIATKQSIIDLFNGTKTALDNTKVAISNIISVEAHNDPLVVFLFKYYGKELELYRDKTMALNPNIDIFRVTGKVQIIRPQC